VIQLRREQGAVAGIWLLLAALVAVIAAMLFLAGPARAGSTFEVNTTADPATPTTTGCDQAECTLREAVAAANDEASNPGEDTITFSSSLAGQTITLSNAQGTNDGAYALGVSSRVVIEGPEGGITLTRAGNVSVLRFFYVVDTRPTGNVHSLTMSNVTLNNGRANFIGGAILNDFGGTVNLTNVSLTNNKAPSTGQGGAIYNFHGTVTIEDSTISGNSARFGGVISQDSGTVTIEDSTMNGNWTPNQFTTFGGVSYSWAGTVTVRNSTVSGSTMVYGAGMYNDGGSTLNVENSTISGNSAGDGGGIYNNSGTARVKNSTISGNSASAGGGIYNKATLNVTGSTLSDNSYNAGSGIYNFSGTANVGNTIIAGNDADFGDPDVRGTFTSQGYNLIGDADGSTGFTQTGDQTGGGASVIDPKLGPLQYNGGPTKTYALLFGSPAIDKGKALGLTTDQRGETRPTDVAGVPNAGGGDGSDAGAVEFKPTSAVADSYATDEDTPLNVPASGVLENDAGGDGGPLSASVVSGPDHGELSLQSGGSFTYTPDANYAGPDSFTYKASAGTFESEAAQVNITVHPVNDAPVATNDDYSVDEDTPLTVNAADGVLDNDTDTDGDALTATQSSGPSHGTLALDSSGSFVYTPATDYVGPDSFTYKADDGPLESGVATVDIEVHDATAPTVVGSPKGNKISPNARVKATFSEEMDKDTLVTDPAEQSSTTFVLVKKGATKPVGAKVVAVENASGDTVATLDPDRALKSGATYTATVTTGATDLEGNALAGDVSWSLTIKPMR
jgi:CSLREA domain-containing protein